MICRVCGAVRGHTVYEAREMMAGVGDTHRYFECANCGCLQIEALPGDLGKYYANAYYSYEPYPTGKPLHRWMKRQRGRYAALGKGVIGRLLQERRRTHEFDYLEPMGADVNEDMRIVDVGCGRGFILTNLADVGFRRLLGIDPLIDADFVNEGGVEIRKQHVEDLGGEFDLVMYNHSFEHLWDPYATLEITRRLPRPGGWCLLRIPTVSSYAWKRYGVNWVQLDAPRHLYLYSRGSIDRLARSCGFEIVHSHDDSTAFQFWGSEQYARGITLSNARSWGVAPDKSPFKAEDIAGYAARAHELNRAQQGDQVCLYLRRP